MGGPAAGVGRGVLRVEPDRLGEIGDRPGHLVLRRPDTAADGIRLLAVGIDADRVGAGGDRPVEIAPIHGGMARCSVGLGADVPDGGRDDAAERARQAGVGASDGLVGGRLDGDGDDPIGRRRAADLLPLASQPEAAPVHALDA